MGSPLEISFISIVIAAAFILGVIVWLGVSIIAKAAVKAIGKELKKTLEDGQYN